MQTDIYTQCVTGNLTNNMAAFDLPQLANNGSNSTSCSTDNKGLPFLGLQEFKQTKVCRRSVELAYISSVCTEKLVVILQL